MKNQSSKKTIWQSLISLSILFLFIYLGLGSTSLFGLLGIPISSETKYDKEKDEYTQRIYGYKGESADTSYWINDITGKKDSYGYWQGEAEIRNYSTEIKDGDRHIKRSVERVQFQNGRRDGKSITFNSYTISSDDDDDDVHRYVPDDTVCYDYGNVIPCNQLKKASLTAGNLTAFEVLNNNYPWFVSTLNVLGYTDSCMQVYMDTFEIILNQNTFEISDFNNQYEDVIDILEETPYDSIMKANQLVTSVYGIEMMKESEFRMAIIDQQRDETKTTFEVIQNKYQHFLTSYDSEDSKIQDTEWEMFCNQFDSIMGTLTPLDLEDPFFVDSIDLRIFGILLEFSNTEKSSYLKSAMSKKLTKSPISIINEYKAQTKQTAEFTPKVIAENILATKLGLFLFYGDIPRQALFEAYQLQKQIITRPKLTTNLIEETSGQATFKGTIIKNGGGTINERGVVWGNVYNPVIEDNKIMASNSNETFDVTITDLDDMKSYFARAYATNEAGTSYGNCISFTAQNTVGINEKINIENDIKIYPNPASNKVRIESNFTNPVILQIHTIDGKQIKQIKEFQNGYVDISDFTNGIYVIRITDNTNSSTKKLIVKQ